MKAIRLSVASQLNILRRRRPARSDALSSDKIRTKS